MASIIEKGIFIAFPSRFLSMAQLSRMGKGLADFPSFIRGAIITRVRRKINGIRRLYPRKASRGKSAVFSPLIALRRVPGAAKPRQPHGLRLSPSGADVKAFA
jgi:hypothetical protein